ncbi:MAG: hypothetical protein ACI9XZ_003397, partial [Alphaproteobacteria bacterium]
SLHPIRASPPPLLMTTPNLICPTLSATIFNSLLGELDALIEQQAQFGRRLTLKNK